jgi:pre-mRNA-splicing factor SYF1
MPEDAEMYIDYLKSIDRLDEAATRLAELVNQVRFIDNQINT